MSYPNRFQRLFEIKDIEAMETFDEADALKIVEQNGQPCLIDMRDYPEQEQHESSFNYSSERGER